MARTQPRVLVIDPDPCIRTLLAAVARRRGMDSDTAADLDEALEHAHARDYTAVILEPRMRGGEVLLREFPAGNVILATTAMDVAPRPGVAAVLRKPFRLDELSSAIDICCAART